MRKETNLITKTRHVGLVVRDLNLALKFYEGLGFDLWKRELEEGLFIEKVVGISNVRVETAKLKAPDESMLELLQYHSHPMDAPLVNSPSNQLGCSHIAFTVQSIEDTCALIRKLGGSIVNSPALAPGNKVKVAYAHDRDGILLELVEEL